MSERIINAETNTQALTIMPFFFLSSFIWMCRRVAANHQHRFIQAHRVCVYIRVQFLFSYFILSIFTNCTHIHTHTQARGQRARERARETRIDSQGSLCIHALSLSRAHTHTHTHGCTVRKREPSSEYTVHTHTHRRRAWTRKKCYVVAVAAVYYVYMARVFCGGKQTTHRVSSHSPTTLSLFLALFVYNNNREPVVCVYALCARTPNESNEKEKRRSKKKIINAV